MAQKLGRNYSLTVSGEKFGPTITIGLPFTVEFDITRNTLTSANVCQIRIRNLNSVHRNQLRKNVTNYSVPIVNVTLRAGYGQNLPIIFTGNVSQCWSTREGVDYVTQIECYDGGFAFINGQCNITVPAGTPIQTVVAQVIGTLPGVTLGAVGTFVGSTTRQQTFSGNTIDVLNQLCGQNGFFIDLGVGNALGDSDVLMVPAINVNASSGLLGTPILEQNIVRFDMIFEPSLSVGSPINLTAVSSSNSNGVYKTTAVKHRGMISQSVSGSVITSGEFFALGAQTGVPNA